MTRAMRSIARRPDWPVWLGQFLGLRRAEPSQREQLLRDRRQPGARKSFVDPAREQFQRRDDVRAVE